MPGKVNEKENYDGSKPLSNKRREKFIGFYLKSFNGAESATKAGYSKRSAKVTASRILTDDNVQKRLQYLSSKVAEKSIRDAIDVLEDLQTVKSRCMQEVMHIDDDGKFGEFKFDASNAIRALELEGKYYKMWTDKVEHSGEIEIDVTLDD